ncbi:MAG: Cell elongation specific D,D-transpeptidase [Parcubacteria group bacterium GW2011_GWD2_43_10]|nr:MAG: Cell elongation specific D,D-transpeptidase [Parcubacteria group bacterium GW2011_GWD2_43_10]
MPRQTDPFIIKEWGGNISDRNVQGWSWRLFEGTSLGEPGVGSLRQVISQRAPLILILVLGLALVLLASRVIWLQGWQGNYWRGVAEGNRIRIETVNASRGLIVDRQGKILAHNVASFRLVAVPAELPQDEIKREEFLTSVLADVPTELLLQDNITQLSQPSYLPLIIASSLPHELALKLMTLVGEGTGLRVEPAAERRYDGGEAIAHVIGYVGPVSPEEYKAEAGVYKLTDTKGKVGLEASYETVLRGQPGVRQVEVDASGLERKIFATKPAVAGAKLKLTIDSSLQQVAYESLKRAVVANAGKGGSVVVLNPNDGSVLALVSYPSFDLNVFTIERSSEIINQLLTDDSHPLFNRSLGGEYPSGSTIKPVVAAAALQERVITPSTTFMSTGGVYAGQQFFADWKAGGHGLTNVYKAIAESVNTFFYLIGGGSDKITGLGITRLSNYFKKFGLGKITGINLLGEQSGFVPTPLWKQEVMQDRWYRGDTYNVSIGQGNLLVTPLQMAVAYSALVTDGQLVRPYLVDDIILPDDQVKQESKLLYGNVGLSAQTLAVVKQGMRQTVTLGSARSLSSLPISVAGKTGTAQTGLNTKPHAWFAGYAPADKPEIVLVTMIEYGGEGSQAAVPIAREIFSWFAQDSERLGLDKK